MSNHKRTFCELQEVDGQSLDYPFTSKKLKIQSDHPLKLYVRLRPTPSDPKSANTGDAKALIINLEENTISVSRHGNQAGKNEIFDNSKFSFTKVFTTDTSQQEIMKTVGMPLFDELLPGGKPGLVLSYGSTITEKMYTLVGTTEDPGILPRSIEVLLDMKTRIVHGLSEKVTQWLSQGQDTGLMKTLEVFEDKSKDLDGNGGGQAVDLRIYIEAFEIYNEEVYDLLKDPKKENSAGLEPKQKVLLKDLSIVELTSQQQTTQILARCQTNLEKHGGFSSERSLKSHIVFRLIVKYAHKTATQNTTGPKQYTTTSLCLVSIAAPEKLQKGNAIPSPNESIEEIISLDSSVSDQGTKKPPSKEYKLTRVLYKYFSGDCNLRLIAHLNDKPTNTEEVMNILNYTAQVRSAKVPSAPNLSTTSKLNSESITKALLFQENAQNSIPILSIKDENASPSFKSLSNVPPSCPSVEKFQINLPLTLPSNIPSNLPSNLPSAQKPQENFKATPKAQNIKAPASVQTINSVQSSARKPGTAPNNRASQENRASSCTSRPPYGNSNPNKKIVKVEAKKIIGNKGTALPEKPNPLKKDMDLNVKLTEKDLKIKVLEELLHKLEDQVLMQSLTDKIQSIDESYNNSLKNLINTMQDTTKMGFLNFNSNPYKKNNISEDKMECCFSKGPFSPTTTMVPVNVNYFIFQGPMGTERISSLESIFRANADKSVGQNHILVMENQEPPSSNNKQNKMEVIEEKIEDDMKVE